MIDIDSVKIFNINVLEQFLYVFYNIDNSKIYIRTYDDLYDLYKLCNIFKINRFSYIKDNNINVDDILNQRDEKIHQEMSINYTDTNVKYELYYITPYRKLLIGSYISDHIVVQDQIPKNEHKSYEFIIPIDLIKYDIKEFKVKVECLVVYSSYINVYSYKVSNIYITDINNNIKTHDIFYRDYMDINIYKYVLENI